MSWQISFCNLAKEIRTLHRSWKWNQQFYIRGLDNLQPLFAGAGRSTTRGNQNQNANHQADLYKCTNQQYQLTYAPPLRPAQVQVTDLALLQIFSQMQQLMQWPSVSTHQQISELPSHQFDGSNPISARHHWVAFENYLTFQTRQYSMNTFDEFKRSMIW